MLQKWHHLLLRQKYVRSQRSLRFPHLKLKIPSPEGLGKVGERGWIAKGTRVDSDRGWHQAPPPRLCVGCVVAKCSNVKNRFSVTNGCLRHLERLTNSVFDAECNELGPISPKFHFVTFSIFRLGSSRGASTARR